MDHLDYMICTHAHEDHVGGLSAPFSVMPVGAVYAPVTNRTARRIRHLRVKYMTLIRYYIA